MGRIPSRQLHCPRTPIYRSTFHRNPSSNGDAGSGQRLSRFCRPQGRGTPPMSPASHWPKGVGRPQGGGGGGGRLATRVAGARATQAEQGTDWGHEHPLPSHNVCLHRRPSPFTHTHTHTPTHAQQSRPKRNNPKHRPLPIGARGGRHKHMGGLGWGMVPPADGVWGVCATHVSHTLCLTHPRFLVWPLGLGTLTHVSGAGLGGVARTN